MDSKRTNLNIRTIDTFPPKNQFFLFDRLFLRYRENINIYKLLMNQKFNKRNNHTHVERGAKIYTSFSLLSKSKLAVYNSWLVCKRGRPLYVYLFDLT